MSRDWTLSTDLSGLDEGQQVREQVHHQESEEPWQYDGSNMFYRLCRAWQALIFIQKHVYE